jgi:hypothetical protein
MRMYAVTTVADLLASWFPRCLVERSRPHHRPLLLVWTVRGLAWSRRCELIIAGIAYPGSNPEDLLQATTADDLHPVRALRWSAAQLAVAFVLSQPAITAALIGPRTITERPRRR